MRVCVGESGAQFEAEAREGMGRMRGFCVVVVRSREGVKFVVVFIVL